MSDDPAAHRLPLTMRAVFQDVLLVTYAVPTAALAALLPAKVRPFVHGGQSFVSIVVANIRGMRPGALPEAVGSNYYQIVYRAVVRLRGVDGRERPGVFFLRSDGNDPVMNFFGNRLTEFRFHYFRRSSIGLFERGHELLASVESADGGGDLVLHFDSLGPAERHPPAEPFADVAEEKRTLVELFHAFAHDGERRVIYDLEIERGEWALERLRYVDGFSAYFAESPFALADPRPVSSLHIRECAYVWKPMTQLPDATLI